VVNVPYFRIIFISCLLFVVVVVVVVVVVIEFIDIIVRINRNMIMFHSLQIIRGKYVLYYSKTKF
jgi:hypothetical protein